MVQAKVLCDELSVTQKMAKKIGIVTVYWEEKDGILLFQYTRQSQGSLPTL